MIKIKKKYLIAIYLLLIVAYLVILTLNSKTVIKNMPFNYTFWMFYLIIVIIRLDVLLLPSNKEQKQKIAITIVFEIFVFIIAVILSEYSIKLMKWENPQKLMNFNSYVFNQNYYINIDNYIFIKDGNGYANANYYKKNGDYYSGLYNASELNISEKIKEYRIDDRKLIIIESKSCDAESIIDEDNTEYRLFNSKKKWKNCIYGTLVQNDYESEIKVDNKNYSIK